MKPALIIFLLLFFFSTNAQKVLTIEDAVGIALKNNFDILVSRNDAKIDKVNNTAGNAGMLPYVSLVGTGNLVQSTSLVSLSTQLSWTLYDGGKMFVSKNKLNEVEALGEIRFKEQVLQTLYAVTAAYYDVVRQKQQLKSITETLNYNRERVTIAQAGFKAGSLLKFDLLQAQIDLNVNTENLINQQFAIDASKKTLNLLLAQTTNETVEIADSIPFNYSPDKKELLQKLDVSNTNILSYQKQIEISELTLKENRSSYLPTVNFNAGLYSVSDNYTIYPQLGGSVIVPLYSAGENKRKVNTAKLQVQSAEYDLQNIKLEVKTEFENTYSEFENQQQLLKIEAENNELAKENIEISLQRLRLGQTTSLEVRRAQEDYVQSCTRLINFKYNLKIAETKLKQLVSAL